MSRLTSGMLLEQISTGDFNVGYLQVVGSLVGQILAQNARPEVAAHWVPQITSGEGIVGIGLSEPHAGSDAGNPRLRAEQDGEGADWVITGAKSMSLLGPANGAVVFARTSDEGRGRGITAFVVDLNQPGVTKEPYSDMGTKASPAAPRTSTMSGCRPRTSSARSARASPRSCRASTSAGR